MTEAANAALREGQPLADIELRLDDGSVLRTAELRGRRWVLYVYPRDDTPGCTTEAVDFTGLLPQFHALGIEVVGISPDSADSHRCFREKHGLAVKLASDPDMRAIRALGAFGVRRLYGRDVKGVIRSTVLVDERGIVRRVWSNVRAAGHAAQVLEEARRIFGGGGS